MSEPKTPTPTSGRPTMEEILDGTTGGENSAPVLKTLPDGTVVQWDGKQWVLAPEMFQAAQKQNIPIAQVPMSSAFEAASQYPGVTPSGAGDYLSRLPGASTGTGYATQNSATGQNEINAARMAWVYGQARPEDINVLLAAGEISPNDARKALGLDTGGDGSGVGYANLAQRQLEFEQTKKQDALTTAIAILREITGMQQQQDTRAQAGFQNEMAALPYAVDPNQEYFSGFEPESYAARMGLITPQRIQHTRVQTQAPPNPWDTVADSALERLRAATQVGV